MPAATEQPAAKKERDELLWQALKEHIMKERQKKKEGKYTNEICGRRNFRRNVTICLGFVYRTRGRGGRGTIAQRA